MLLELSINMHFVEDKGIEKFEEFSNILYTELSKNSENYDLQSIDLVTDTRSTMSIFYVFKEDTEKAFKQLKTRAIKLTENSLNDFNTPYTLKITNEG